MRKIHQQLLKLQCYVFSFILAFSLIGLFLCSVSSVTLANSSYLYNAFNSAGTTNELYSNLQDRLEDVSEKINVDKDTLVRAVGTDFINTAQTTVIKNIYSGETYDFDTSSDLSSRYKNSIESYYKQNNISYTDSQLNEAVGLCVGAFNDTCGIKNDEQLAPLANFISNNCLRLTIAFFALIVICAFVVITVNGRRHKGFNYIAMSLMIAGDIMIVLPSISFASGSVSRLVLTNIDAYNQALNQIVSTIFIISIIVGIVLDIIAISIFAVNYRYYSYRLMKNETEHEINKNLI